MEKVIDIADRIPTLREKRRKRSNRKFLILILIFLLTLFLLLYFQSPYSEIDKIKIVGADIVPAEKYLQQSNLSLGESMWGFRQKEIEEKIEKLKWVKNVHVKRKLLTTVIIEVEEYKKVAYVTDNNVFYPLLENGYVLETSREEPIDAPVFVNFKDEMIREKLLNELGKLDSSILPLISEIHSNGEKDPYGITLFMNDGYEVRAEVTSLAKKLNYYPSIVAQINQTGSKEKGIIDIEVGTYYRPYSDEYGNNKVAIKTEDKEKKGEEKIE